MLSPENVLSYGPVPLSEAKLAAATSPLPYSCHDNRGQNVDGGNGVDSGTAAFEPTGVDSRHSAAAVFPEKDGEAEKLQQVHLRAGGCISSIVI